MVVGVARHHTVYDVVVDHQVDGDLIGDPFFRRGGRCVQYVSREMLVFSQGGLNENSKFKRVGRLAHRDPKAIEVIELFHD